MIGVNAHQLFGDLPNPLRDSLCGEYRAIVKNFSERRWGPSELSGGRFCEVVYSILDGYASGTYPSKPSKPRNFVGACRSLENHSSVPRSFQILIPRMLPALYEIRNNRNVGHVGGDVDPNHMDSIAVVTTAGWIMAELVRVFHKLPSMDEAQSIVDSLAERKVPLVWKNEKVRRVLNPKLKLPQQILLLLSSSAMPVAVSDMLKWTECSTRGNLNRALRRMHAARNIEFDETADTIAILPPGALIVEELL